MFGGVAEFVSTQQGDSPEFIEKVQALAIGVARDFDPPRFYVVRIDNWFGPKWMNFAGKTLGLVGIHPLSVLHVPPFVPHRVVAERVFAGPGYEETVALPSLHIECPGSRALQRRIADIDKDAAFVWFSGESKLQKRGAVMVYLPVDSETTGRGRGLSDCGAFYVGYSLRETNWELSMLRGTSRGEVAHLLDSGRAMAAEPA